MLRTIIGFQKDRCFMALVPGAFRPLVSFCERCVLAAKSIKGLLPKPYRPFAFDPMNGKVLCPSSRTPPAIRMLHVYIVNTSRILREVPITKAYDHYMHPVELETRQVVVEPGIEVKKSAASSFAVSEGISRDHMISVSVGPEPLGLSK